ncbi:DUF2161 family putative PD-(D/E)XK-type phosphodiesterase [Paenibacillus taichungensis]|uniref:DUF2161 domain-containing phosphodiesterase n=1 Tax=Paenibacillus taichungensis TaxID=484184 RepID=UPI002DC04F3B|nr:DUF2161 family putative PD-(D/E)XK-type phosphodiesterase [Paenibacillus taichungensis]MEC0107226.1 DUF2161 family putative PD-(D/E)XK-type phosphodiesterase [Paenibacillus taichungensis]MEC0194842.1 DUF2161 family putative PD-(D/E)XK-type phosphodiesterase [Paenibacillus taichungensis]
MAVKYETELYSPIKAFFERRGYDVKAEVKHCDLVGVKSDQNEPLIVEMKKTFNLSLLLQGMQRLKLSPFVYLAVERNRSKRGAVNQRWGELTALCRQLGLGLITVTFYKTKSPLIDVLCEPAVQSLIPGSGTVVRKGGIRRQRLLKEFDERSGDYNTGGSTRRQLVTAYREKALRVASALRDQGEASPASISKQTSVGSAAAILQKNYYGWFERLSRGRYVLTVKGVQALTEHAHMLEDNDMIERSINELEIDFSLNQHEDSELEHIAEVAEPYLIHGRDD